MTYPEDVLKAAERVTALFRPVLTFREAERLRDDIAWEIMAERQRCAGIASHMEIGGIVETPEFITAILGQQESSHGGA